MRADGSLGWPGTDGGFFNYFFSIHFPTYFILNGLSSKPLSTYVRIYLIYVEGARNAGVIFIAPNSWVRRIWKVVSHDRNISQGIFDAAEYTQAPGGVAARDIRTVATPGRPRDQTRMPGCHPECHRSPIPAIHPYWEYLVSPIAGLDNPMRRILMLLAGLGALDKPMRKTT